MWLVGVAVWRCVHSNVPYPDAQDTGTSLYRAASIRVTMTIKWRYCNRSYYGKPTHAQSITLKRGIVNVLILSTRVCATCMWFVCIYVIIATWFVVCSNVLVASSYKLLNLQCITNHCFVCSSAVVGLSLPQNSGESKRIYIQ